MKYDIKNLKNNIIMDNYLPQILDYYKEYKLKFININQKSSKNRNDFEQMIGFKKYCDVLENSSLFKKSNNELNY